MGYNNQQQFSVDINSFLFKNYITYDRLYEMNIKAFYGKTDANTANIFIDMRSFTSSLFNRPDIVFSFEDSETPVASSLINLATHLRHFYRSRFMTEVNIYLVWGANLVSMSPASITYNSHHNATFASNINMRVIVHNAIKILSVICKYLPNIYFIDVGPYETALGIQMALNNPDKSHIYTGVPNIIYSKDPYCTQLVSDNSYTFMFYFSRSTGKNSEDKSFLVEKSNIFDSYSIMNNYSLNRPTPTPDRMDLFKTAIAMSGMKCRHVDGLVSYNTACKMLATYKDIIPVGYIEPYANLTALWETKGFTPVQKRAITDMESLKKIYEELDVQISTMKFSYTNDAINMFEGCINLYSPEDIKAINNKYFKNYPIDIMKL